MAEGKSWFSELFIRALLEGPQVVSRRGDCVVVISKDERLNLAGHKPNFIEFMVEGNLDLGGVDFERDKSLSRKVDLGCSC